MYLCNFHYLQRYPADLLNGLCEIDQSVISKLENGTSVPGLKMLKRLAAGPGKTVKIEIELTRSCEREPGSQKYIRTRNNTVF